MKFVECEALSVIMKRLLIYGISDLCLFSSIPSLLSMRAGSVGGGAIGGTEWCTTGVLPGVLRSSGILILSAGSSGGRRSDSIMLKSKSKGIFCAALAGFTDEEQGVVRKEGALEPESFV